MSDEGPPDSGGASTSTTASTVPSASGTASWNPALRPDSHAELVAVSAIETSASVSSKPLSNVPALSKHIDQSMVQQHVTPAVEIEDGEAHQTGEEENEDAATSTQYETIKAQEKELGNRLHLPSQEPTFITSPGLETPMPLEEFLEETRSPSVTGSDSASVDSRPGTSHAYDYQGETLAMEEAVDEAPSAPLLDDAEDPPVVEELKREPTLHAVNESSIIDSERDPTLARSQLKDQPQPGHIDRSFTTNFTEIQTPIDTQIREPESSTSAGWPSAGDDKTFAELLDDDTAFNATSKEAATDVLHNDAADDVWGVAQDDSFGELLGNGRTLTGNASVDLGASRPTDGITTDLTAVWQAALDDDDLLDESNDLDPSVFFGDDDPGFLEDELLTVQPEAARNGGNQLPRTTSPYVPATSQQSTNHSKSSTLNPSLLSHSHGRSAGTPSTGLYDVYGHGAMPQQQPQQRPSAHSAQSFVDKAKGGYQSPYDLPMEVVKQPRQRPRQVQSGLEATPVPPPRSSSMSSQTGPPQPRPSLGPPRASLTPSPGVDSASPAPHPSSTVGAAHTKSISKSEDGFFADLPVAPKPRTRVSGIYTPQAQGMSTTPPSSTSTAMPPRPTIEPLQPPQRPTGPQAHMHQQNSSFGGLTQPERLPLLPDQPIESPPVHQQPSTASLPGQRYSPSSLPAPSQPQNRFSPAPPTASPSSTSRYSPAPAAQASGTKKYSISGPAAAHAPPGIQNSHPFAPRTSSPLAFATDKAQMSPPTDAYRQLPQTPVSPPKPNGTRSISGMSSDHSSPGYSSGEVRATPGASMTSPPQRVVTQSPPLVMKSARYSVPTPSGLAIPSAPSASSGKPTNFLPHRRQMSRELNFTPPDNEHAQDPLQRWQGYPIFRWGESGVVIHSFPKQTPFYAAGHGIPSVKCTPGAISVQLASTFMPMDDQTAKFPGPLTARAKGRKKEVLSWMTAKIEDLERRFELIRMDFEMEPDLKKRSEEKLILWKIVKIFVEHDGKLEGDRKIEDEVRSVLLPNIDQIGQILDLQSPISASIVAQTDGVDRGIIIQLRKALLEGDRERAVWLAEEKKLWGHAMLIASTMGPETWKQIIQSFVRSQVKTAGSDARSLAALYQVFAGNAEECVDELVPPSARAGFQMVSKSDGAIAGDPLEGLDQWRETLGLVAGNRTPSDQQSLLALGKLLSSYGRAEAAHTCFLFARQTVKHSGADDADASFTILGANHQTQQGSSVSDLDAIILTEIYEWASSLTAPSNAVHYVPHLQSFKLIHAQELAASGLKSKAQSYCDHITSAYTSTTRPSPYYHPTFTQAVADLSAFLSQTPHAGSAGLLSKGAMNKVSSGAASWFTKFVSGDDDRESNGSGPIAGEDGPFGRVSGGSPGISRSGSQADLYNPVMGGGIPFASTATLGSPPKSFAPSSAPGRYAPIAGANKYAPMTGAGVSAPAQRLGSPVRPASARNYSPVAAAQPLVVPRPESNRAASDYSMPYMSDSRRGSAQYPGSQGSYEPRPLLAEDTPSYGYQPDAPAQPLSTLENTQNINGLGVAPRSIPNAVDEGYRPSSSGYEPPSYQPYEPEPEAENDETAPKPKKKSFMDDDDDDAPTRQNAAQQKAEADRKADEAFRKAAEADANRDRTRGGAGNRGSWFGGWFGKKDPNGPQTGPIKAKLGEENSFYYDENLKKWVNKKGGADAATPAAATPPPPKGPPSRAVSATTAMGPPSGPPSRVSSAPGMPGMPLGAPAPSSAAGSGPPSRAGTPATGDAPLSGAAAALQSGEARPPSAPPVRPSTAMSNASSLDDLLGGPPGPGQRKAGGTVKGKKRAARYVDVMKS